MTPYRNQPTVETATYLFTDVEASTAAWETSSDMSVRLHRHLAIIEDAVESAGGTVFARLGDGVAATFPSAHAAVGAAVTAQRRLPTSGLRSRMGLHTGEAEQVGSDHRGRAVNRAARIMAMGHGGQVLLSDVTASIIRTGPAPVALVDLGLHRLRGVTEPERLWQARVGIAGDRFAPVRGLGDEKAIVPTPRTELIGRERDVARIDDVVRSSRIVTLVGPGGVGKTMLVQRAAVVLPSLDGARFVELAHLPHDATVDEIAGAIGAALGAHGGATPIDGCTSMVGGHTAVLVIDNCEHVVDGIAAVISHLTDRCAGLTVVATSREPLGIDGEHVVRVRPLAHRAAVALFRLRATAAGAEAETMSDDLVERVVGHLDGLPLAIEIAAARAATLGLEAMADGLRLRIPPSRRRRGRVDRHATMDAAIGWSHDLLDADERALLGSLAVFPNGSDMDAVLHVADGLGLDPVAATDRLTSLVDKSLLGTDVGPSGVRYRMLETMRSFVIERLDQDGSRLAAQLSMAEWVASFTDVPFRDAGGLATEQGTLRLETEADTWREALTAAVRAGRADLAARLCGPPTAFFLLGRHDLSECTRAAADLCRTDPRHRRATLCALMVSAAGTSDPDLLRSWTREMVDLDEHDPTGLSNLMRWLAGIWTDDIDDAVTACLDGADDPRLPGATRDLLLAIGVLDRFSLTGATDDRHGLVDRAIACADRSPSALTRVAARLGAAWALAGTAPDRCVDLVHSALSDLDRVPPLTRRTLPGSAFRLLAGLDPAVAAQGLLDQLDAVPARRTFVDLVPLAYGNALLERVGHDAASPVRADLPDEAAHVSMMDAVEHARRLAAASTPAALDDLEATVRHALAELTRTGLPATT